MNQERILREASSYAWNSYYTMNLTKLAGKFGKLKWRMRFFYFAEPF